MLAWTAPASDGGHQIIAYRIYRGTTPGGETFLTESGNVLNYTDSALTNGQTYYYMLSAKNSAGTGDNSTEVMVTPATAPSQPLNSQAAEGYHLVTLTWIKPASDGGAVVTGYRIYRGTLTGGEALLASVGNTTSYADSGLTAGQAYYYKIAAVNAGGEGPMSSEVSATPTAPPSETGADQGPVNESLSLVLLILALVVLIIAVLLSIVNLRKMKGNSGKKQTEEVRKPEKRQE